MTKINKLKKVEHHYFEKISYSFFIFAYSFMAVSMAYHLYTFKKFNPSKDININVVESEVKNGQNISLQDKINQVYKDSNTNSPNVSDITSRNKILEMANRKSTNLHYLIVDKNGVLNIKKLNILVGDTVIFLNNSNDSITIKGIGTTNFELQPGQNIAQDFFAVDTFKYSIDPFSLTGEITVSVE